MVENHPNVSIQLPTVEKIEHLIYHAASLYFIDDDAIRP